MQLGLNAADRKLLLGALILIVAMAALTGTLAAPDTSGESPMPSTYSSGPGGALASYILLQNLRYPVRRWEDPPARLPESPSPAVLILAEPAQTPSPAERARLHRFIANGGRILFCGARVHDFFPAVSLSPPRRRFAPSESQPDLPSPFTRGIRKITIAAPSYWKQLSPDQIALFGDESKPPIVVWRIGQGELLWWASASPLTNTGIAKADNLSLLLDSVSYGGGVSAPIYWDEYFHGSRGSLWSYVERTPVKWALLQCGLLTLASLFAFSRRSGPIASPRVVSRLSPLEFVETLGGLYQRAGATSVAVGVAYRHLRLTLSRRLLLPSTAPDTALALAAERRLGWSRAEFLPALEKAGGAQTHDLRPREALHIVRTIGYYLDRLADRRTALETK